MIISQDSEDIKNALKLQRKCELKRVALRDCHVSAEGTQETNVGPFSLRISHSSIANAIIEHVLRIHVRFHVECYESADPPSLLFNVECAFDLDYQIEAGFDVPDKSIAAFKDGNALFNCWPYAREFVQSMTSRMDLKPPPIPLLRLVPKPRVASSNVEPPEEAKVSDSHP